MLLIPKNFEVIPFAICKELMEKKNAQEIEFTSNFFMTFEQEFDYWVENGFPKKRFLNTAQRYIAFPYWEDVEQGPSTGITAIYDQILKRIAVVLDYLDKYDEHNRSYFNDFLYNQVEIFIQTTTKDIEKLDPTELNLSMLEERNFSISEPKQNKITVGLDEQIPGNYLPIEQEEIETLEGNRTRYALLSQLGIIDYLNDHWENVIDNPRKKELFQFKTAFSRLLHQICPDITHKEFRNVLLDVKWEDGKYVLKGNSQKEAEDKIKELKITRKKV